MYISEMALLKARLEAEGKLSQSRILQELLREDDQSERKEKMREGERYYRCDHDVRKKDFRSRMISETKNGAEEYRLFQNPNRSNHHNVNPFHRTLVAQKAAYLANSDVEQSDRFIRTPPFCRPRASRFLTASAPATCLASPAFPS